MLDKEFRPQLFKDVVGQGDTPSILRNQIKTGKPAQKFLFAGNRGSGKTTCSRILGKVVNCLNPKDGEPCNECENCKKFDKGTFLDYIEIDAASNNGVDNIREIIKDLQYGPQQGKYKVIVMDEAHMLTGGAANAFLKTLEEPPSYVIFILATTDPQKLPVTVLSRCQRFDFKRIKNEDILNRLKYVVNAKNFRIDGRALNLIAKLADGAMRDALSLLEQAISADEGQGVDYNKVVQMFGVSASEKVLGLISQIINKNTMQALNTLSSIVDDGKDLSIFLQDIIKQYRNILVLKVDGGEDSVNASDEDINTMKELAKLSDADTILRNIRVLQDIEKDLKFISGANLRTAIEMGIVKMTGDTEENRLMTLIKELNEKLKQPNSCPLVPPVDISASVCNTGNEQNISAEQFIEENSESTFNEEQIKVNAAKAQMIETLNKYNKKPIADILSQSDVYFDSDSNFTIHCSNSQMAEYLMSNIKNLENGFKKYLNAQDLIIFITF